MSEVNIWDALSKVRALPLAEVGEEILLAAGDGDPVPTLHILSAIMSGLAHYVTARDAGESREGAERYGKCMRFRSMHGLREDDGYAIAKEEEHDFFGADAYQPSSEVTEMPDRDRRLIAMLSAMNAIDERNYPGTLREYLESVLTPAQLADIEETDVLGEAGIDYIAVYQRYHIDVWNLVMDSEGSGWPEWLHFNRDVTNHSDFCQRIVSRAVSWLSYSEWSIDR